MAKRINKKDEVTDIRKIDYGRVPPQSLEIEKNVIGAILQSEDAFDKVREYIKTPRVFYDERNEIIFTAMCQLAQDKQPIDTITLSNQLQKEGKLQDVGGLPLLASYSMEVTSSANVEYHAKILLQKFIARELIRVTTDIQTTAFDEKLDVDQMIGAAESAIFQMSQHSMKREVQNVSDVVSDAMKRIFSLQDKGGATIGVPSGFKKLDEITSGWQDSDLIIVAGRPAMGKTSFVLSMIANMAVKYKVPCAIFSLEMSALQLVNRLISDVCEIPSEKLRNGKLERYEVKQLTNRIAQLEEAPIFIDDSPSLSAIELRSKAIKLVEEHNVRFIAIDYLQLMNAQGMTFYSREGEVSLISRSLKGLAKELNIPIVALSQLNRQVENRGSSTKADGKKPQLSDLRESGAIEQDADMVCFIHRPEYYGLEQDQNGKDYRGVAQVIIAKYRNGKTGEVDLRFQSEFTKFSDLNRDGIVESRINSDSTDEAPILESEQTYPF